MDSQLEPWEVLIVAPFNLSEGIKAYCQGILKDLRIRNCYLYWLMDRRNILCFSEEIREEKIYVRKTE
jgi:hypothetical protein